MYLKLNFTRFEWRTAASKDNGKSLMGNRRWRKMSHVKGGCGGEETKHFPIGTVIMAKIDWISLPSCYSGTLHLPILCNALFDLLRKTSIGDVALGCRYRLPSLFSCRSAAPRNITGVSLQFGQYSTTLIGLRSNSSAFLCSHYESGKLPLEPKLQIDAV